MALQTMNNISNGVNNFKIAIITPVFPPYASGISTIAYNHANLLQARGQEVAVFTPNYQKSSKTETPPPARGGGGGEVGEEPVFKVCGLKPTLQYGNAAWLPGLDKRLKDFDVVVLQYPFFGAMRAVWQAKKKYGFRLILNYNMDLVGSGWKGLIFAYNTKFFLPKIIKAADLVLASSSDYARHSSLAKFWQDNNPKFQILSNGVDITRCFPLLLDERKATSPPPSPFQGEACPVAKRSPVESRSSSTGRSFCYGGRGLPPVALARGGEGWGNKIKSILFVGALDKAHYFKGLNNLIQAVSQINRNDFKLIIVGGGDMLSYYQSLSKSLGIEDKVNFTGQVTEQEKIRYYQDALVTVLPSIDQSESFGLVLVESLACGTPVIASDLPGVRSVLEEGVTGFKVKPGDVGSLREKLEYVLDNPDIISAMRTACRAQAVEKYDLERIGDELWKLVVGK